MNYPLTDYPDPESTMKHEQLWFERMVQEGKLSAPETIEELPEDFIMEDNESVVVDSTTK